MNKAYFSKKIVEWYAGSHRDLPWRNTQDPYKIWLSEIILQQTRVTQGLPYYKRFIQKYPHVQSLAEAPEREVLRLWQGLGYYSRARNLHLCAQKVTTVFGGKFPRTWRELKSLPGIGDYTAAAIASFAFDQKVAVVDGNVFRVLARIFGIEKDIGSAEGKKFFTDLANQLISHHQPAHHNQAMMEFGAMYCTARNPNCTDCVFKKNCFAFQHEAQNLLPVKQKKKAVKLRHFYYFILRRGKKILMTQRNQQDIWRGLFDLPLLEEKRNLSGRRALEKLFQVISVQPPASVGIVSSSEYKHILTHQVIHARFIELNGTVGKKLSSYFLQDGGWYTARQIEELPKPRLITRYLGDRSIL